MSDTDKVWWHTEDGHVRIRSQEGKCPAIVFVNEAAYGLTLAQCKELHNALDRIIVNATFSGAA